MRFIPHAQKCYKFFRSRDQQRNSFVEFASGRVTFPWLKAKHWQGSHIGAHGSDGNSISNRGEHQLNCQNFSIRRISRTMAPAIAFTLGVTALAQDSAGLRAPRAAFQGAIAERYRAAYIADRGPAVDPNTAQGPCPGTLGPGPGCNLFH